jgi:hypothetical protein
MMKLTAIVRELRTYPEPLIYDAVMPRPRANVFAGDDAWDELLLEQIATQRSNDLGEPRKVDDLELIFVFEGDCKVAADYRR